jgi:putative sterol carrier protein
MSSWNITDPYSFGRALDNRSDDEILVALGGRYEQTCSQVFQAMKQAFMPEKAAGETAVIQYEVKAPDAVHTYQVAISAGKCEVSPGAPASPRVTLKLALCDFLRLVSGRLNGMQAFFTGKLRVSGDMVFAQTMQGWFKRPTD